MASKITGFMREYVFGLSIITIILGLFLPVGAFESDELPFGAFLLHNFSDEAIAEFKHEMCFNLLMDQNRLGDNTLRDITAYGITIVRGGKIDTATAEPQEYYSWGNYAVIDVGVTDG